MNDNDLNSVAHYLSGFVTGIARIHPYHDEYMSADGTFVILPTTVSIEELISQPDFRLHCDFWSAESKHLGAKALPDRPIDFVQQIFRYWLFERPDRSLVSEQLQSAVLDEIWSSISNLAEFNQVFEVYVRRLSRKGVEWPESPPIEQPYAFGGTFILEATNARLAFEFSITN